MDKIIVSNLNRSEEISSFGDRDARYIDSAVAALNKPGDIVIVEAQHRSLRDHYVKQILSLLFSSAPGIVVNRCKKDRDWMISAINQAFVKNKLADKARPSTLSEVWICDLSGGEDFDLLKLGHTLVSQFQEAGVCVLASCSSTITHQDEFCRWSNRLEIPVWAFELPDAYAIDAFLEREAETGAINEARKLVHELRSLEGDRAEKAQVIDLYDLKQTKNDNAADVISSGTETQGQPADIRHQFTLEEHQLKKGAEIFGAELGDHEPAKKKSSEYAPSKKVRAWSKIRTVIFGFFILITCLVSVVVMIDGTAMDGIYRKAMNFSTSKVGEYFTGLAGNGAVSTEEVATLNTDLNFDKTETSVNNLTEVIEEPVFNIEAPVEFTSGAASLLEVVDRDIKTEGTLDVPKTLHLSDSPSKVASVSKVTAEPRVSEDAEMSSNVPIGQRRDSQEYYAQLGAFGTENGAIWWQLSRADSLPKTFIAKKSTGLWAVLSGPFGSRDLANDTFSRIGVDVFVVEGSDLTTD